MSPKCQNCGSHVSDDYARVFAVDGVVECCEQCPDKKRDARGRTREARAIRRVDQEIEHTTYDPAEDPTVATDGGSKSERSLPDGAKKESDDFDVSAGDGVLARVRKSGDTGDILGKFEGEVQHFYTRPGPSADRVVIEPPWDTMSNPMFGPYAVELEVLEGGDDRGE